jgi:hypothetical protein
VVLRWLVSSLAIALVVVVGGLPLRAQRQPQQRPLGPQPDVELRVAPFFDGFYTNPDGTITFSFGYSNLNRQETVEIPLGPDNVIQPKEFDGRQPTSFPPVVADAADDGGAAAGRGRPGRRDRERGVFTVTVPAGFTGDVVWTLRHRGQTYSVPARAKNSAYSLRWPMAMGSMPPLLRFRADGPAGRGPSGIDAGPLQASVGTPLPINISIVDDSKREKEPIEVKAPGANPKAALNVTWYKHAGPGPVTFAPAKQPIPELQGTAATSATFKQPGEYVIRVRADNFGRVDTSAGNQCCWTNGYMKVSVRP